MATSFMSETSSSSSSSSGSSQPAIVKLTPDHLFTILLLLPIESILSFSMTCRKFRSFTSSDALWESICRREWGPTSVAALKSSIINNQQLPWMRLYKQVSQLDSVSCYKLSDPDGDLTFPSPRASHSLNFVSGCLILFGGGSEGGRHLDDTWVAYIGNDLPRMLKWKKVHSGIPSGRFGHTCVVVGEYLVLYGGINDSGIRQNDAWVGQLVFSDNQGITISWRPLNVGSIVPPPRGAHAACCISERKMVIQGGIWLNGIRLSDTWVLELSDNHHFGTWRELITHPSPPARSGHSLTCISGTAMVLFGGRGLGYDVLNDAWLLEISDDQTKWIQLPCDLQTIPEGLSLPRVGHSATLILGSQLLIYGGEDSYRRRKDDFWVLDIKLIPPQRTASSSKGLQANMWKKLNIDGYKPNSRSFHRSCVDHSGRLLFVFGGMVDGLLQPLESQGLLFDGQLFLVELVHLP